MTMLRLSGLATAAFLLSCQTYDFEPVKPLAIAQTTQSRKVTATRGKPNLMLLIDRSGSMGGTDVGATQSRLADLKDAMNTFLTTSGDVARMGLAQFPHPVTGTASCGGTAALTTPMGTQQDSDTAGLRAYAQTINTAVKNISANGGTPTAESLRFLKSPTAGLQDPNHEGFVILLTDGAPNCNINNPNDYTKDVAACACTLTPVSLCATTFPKEGCLDKDNVVSAIRELRQLKIRTIVVGFGADLAGATYYGALNTFAYEGGFARACPNGMNAECGSGDTCDTTTKLCNRKFYRAANATELAAALAAIAKDIGVTPCEYTLEAQPSNPAFLSVIVDGNSIPSGPTTWTLSGGKVNFQGALCTKLEASTPQTPVNVEFRIVETL